MALKYYFEFTDVKAIVHRCEISSDDFTGTATEISGSLKLNSGSVDDSLESIRGNGLILSLDASTSLDFSDLYSQNEFAFKVNYKRNGIFLFDGFLEPEGLYQDFVSDKWLLTLVCVDGLSFLKNLSYVVDATGLTFSGKQKEIVIIANCLKRTKVIKNINVSVNVFYTGLATTECILDNVYLNANRFIKDDKDTIMNCSEVLKSVLDPYSAILLQYNNEWYVFRLSELISSNTLSFFKYDSDGVFDSMNNNVDLKVGLGSQIDNYYPHWVNSNQSITLKGSIGAARVNYKYGLINSFVDNTNLTNNGSVISDYTIVNSTYVDLLPVSGFTINASPASAVKVLEITDNYTVVESDSLTLETVISTDSVQVTSSRMVVKLTGASSTYYLANGGGWVTSSIYITTRAYPGVSTTTLIKSAEYPISGDISFEIYTNKVFVPPGSSGNYYSENTSYSEIRIFPNENDTVEGENHTVQIENNPSTKIKDTIEVFNGDNIRDRFVGTIYKTDLVSTTSTWFRLGITEAKPIIQIMAEEILRINAAPAKIFSGDVFGFVSFFSVITINNLTGKFFPIESSYNAIENVTTLKLIEVFTAEIADIDYELTYDYGNVVEPTIKG